MVNRNMSEEKNLNLTDLLQIQKIIDVAVQRGAFKAEESRIVGETYEKISDFLSSFETNNDEGSDQTESSTTESPEEDSEND